MKRVRFYQEDHRPDKKEMNDISLGKKLRQLTQSSIKKCKNRDCLQHLMYHTYHFFHQSGYVEMKMRFSKNEN